jgi:hypothetical protein
VRAERPHPDGIGIKALGIGNDISNNRILNVNFCSCAAAEENGTESAIRAAGSARNPGFRGLAKAP